MLLALGLLEPMLTSEKFDSLNSKVQAHLDMQGPEIESILKGHLVIEELLFKILASTTSRESLIRKADLSFFKTAVMVEALHQEKCPEWVWEAVLLLNTIRNKVAHHLHHNEVDEMIKNFIKLVSENMILSSALSELNGNKALPSTIATLCVVLTDIWEKIET